MAQLRMVFLGTSGAFSAATLEALLRSGPAPVAVALPAFTAATTGLRALPAANPARGLPLATVSSDAPNILAQAHARGVPAYELGRGSDAEEGLRGLAPVVCCVACWPWRIPPALLAIPRLGWLNAHPSILPDNRGPDPLFWTLHAGQRETGVTIHTMSNDFDKGAIFRQAKVALIPGETEGALEWRLAETGGHLMAEVLRELERGEALPMPQDETLATWHGWPTASDYVITPSWSAERAYIFASGVLERSQPVTVEVENKSFQVVRAHHYALGDRLGQAYSYSDELLRLQCLDGIFVATVHEA